VSYQSALATAKRLITKKGKNVTITRQVDSVFDPALGVDTSTEQSQTIKAVVLPVTGGKAKDLDQRFKLESFTIEKLAYFIMYGNELTFQPEAGQKVTIASEDWTILGVTPTNPNEGDPIIYEVAIRL
jgi:hypothetical protein